MSFELSSTSKALIGAGAVITASVAGGVILFNTIQRPVPDEKSALATAAFAQADEAAKGADGASTETSEPGASTEITEPGSSCPADMMSIAAKQGGLEACGTGRPPVVAPNPLDGVWEVDSPGNPKIDALTIFMHSQYGVLHRGDPNNPSPAHAVWRLKDAGSYWGSGFAVRLSVAEDGTVETGTGQFEYCNCVQLKWRVRSTSDPNVMIGEWRYDDEKGVSIWRRRSGKGVVRSVIIGNAFKNEEGQWSSDQFGYRSRAGRLELSDFGAIWITVLGENFAGAHDVWIDPATRFELREAGWVCKNGETIGRNAWYHCGVGANPGETVAGIKVKFRLRDGMIPGPINLWIDGQPIPINVTFNGYPEEEMEKPQLVTLQAFDLENNKIPSVTEGEPFVLEAVFDGEHPDSWVSVELPLALRAVTAAANPDSDWGETAPTKVVTLQRTADNKTFRSAALAIKPTEDGEE